MKKEFDTHHYLRWTTSNYNDTCYDLTEARIQTFDNDGKTNKLTNMIMKLSAEQCTMWLCLRIFSNHNILNYNQYKHFGFSTTPKTILHLLESCPGLSNIRARIFEGETEIIEILKNKSSSILQKLKMIIKFFKESNLYYYFLNKYNSKNLFPQKET